MPSERKRGEHSWQMEGNRMSKIRDIGQEIVILRANKGWTQQQFAEKLGTTQKTVGTWESGESAPRKAMQVRIAQLFGLPGNYFWDNGENASANENTAAGERDTPPGGEKEDARMLFNKISDVMEGAGGVSDETKKKCMEAIWEIMDIKK